MAFPEFTPGQMRGRISWRSDVHDGGQPAFLCNSNQKEKINMSETKTTTIRAPFDLHEWIEAQAEKEHRSTHGQIIYILSEAKKAAEANE